MATTISNTNESDTDWVFGYGSLIYKVDFPVLERAIATIEGWERRFWQASHDHRGTPDSPGRVLTLVPAPGKECRGVAWRVEHSVYEHLDHREKNGYERHRVAMKLEGRSEPVQGTFYVAPRDNPAFLGPEEPDAMAAQIASSKGPSGSNRDYLLQLAEALRGIGAEDDHVFDLERRVQSMTTDGA
ncbi:gamma-glutamylcyclotransferase [Leptolyngbya valderiana BDU 20041]|nr:gamma-glutamylcyclotransferase [Leptolyngbya valderiana BDU 20041]